MHPGRIALSEDSRHETGRAGIEGFMALEAAARALPLGAPAIPRTGPGRPAPRRCAPPDR